MSDEPDVLKELWSCLNCNTIMEAGELMAGGGRRGLFCPHCKSDNLQRLGAGYEDVEAEGRRAILYDGDGRMSQLPDDLADALADMRRQLADMARKVDIVDEDNEVLRRQRDEAQEECLAAKGFRRLAEHERDEAERLRQLDLDLAERHMNEKHERGRQLAEARAEVERLTRERDAWHQRAVDEYNVASACCADEVALDEAESRAEAAERERDRYKAERDQAREECDAACETAKERRDAYYLESVRADRYKALAEGERERIADAIRELQLEGGSPSWNNAYQAAVEVITTLPAPSLPEEPQPTYAMPSGHAPDCDWHLDQYPWDCTCGASAAKAAVEELQPTDKEPSDA